MTTTDDRDALAALVYRVNNPKHGDYGSHQETADAILAAGWRPPLPAAQVEIDDEADAWYVRVLDVDVHHTTESAPVNIDWTRDGQLIGVELLGPLKHEASSPLPDSETDRQRWFVIAGPGIPTELGERPLEADWDGIVYPGLTADLAASLAACRQTYDDWGVYELVRVEDPEVTS